VIKPEIKVAEKIQVLEKLLEKPLSALSPAPTDGSTPPEAKQGEAMEREREG
jgi:hypothetical protein